MIHELPVAQSGPIYAPATTLMLAVTDDCPLDCNYCFVKKKPRRMSSETARKAVEFFLSRDISGAAYRININFFGGEPFLELDRMEEVVALAQELGPNVYKKVRFSATTSGTIATARVERLVKNASMGLLVSIDGTRDASKNRLFHSGRESYSVVARNLPKLIEWTGGDLVVRMTFTPDNLDFVSNVQNALELGAPLIALCPVLEFDWENHQVELEAAYDQLLDWVTDELRAGRVPPLDATWGLFWQHDRAIRWGGGRPDRPCSVGTSLLAVNPDGAVMPCHRFLYRPQDWLGTVESARLSDERWKYVHLNSRDLLGCETCPANRVCGGGCRAVVLNTSKGLHDLHPPYCVTMLAHFRAVKRVYELLMEERNQKFLEVLRTHQIPTGPLAELSRVG